MASNSLLEKHEITESKRFKVKAGVFLVLIENEEVLLLRRYNTGIADGAHVLPMGCIQDDESATEALVREANEEVNLSISLESLQLVHLMHRHHHLPDGNSFKQIDFYFQPSIYEGEIINREPDKCDEVKFYPLDALPETTEPFIISALNSIRHHHIFSEFGWRGING